jgi:hypothetical protein
MFKTPGLVAATMLAASLVAAPLAQARDWHGGGGHGWHGGGGHGGWHGGGGGNAAAAAILGGLVGLGVGAAIAGSPAYAPPPVAYPAPPPYYGAPPGYYGY